MTLQEALDKAKEAKDNGYLMPFPQACIVLAKEVERLKNKLEKEKENA